MVAFLDKLEVWPIIYSLYVKAAVEQNWSAVVVGGYICAFPCMLSLPHAHFLRVPLCEFLSQQHAFAHSIESGGCSFMWLVMAMAECQCVATWQDFDRETMATQIKKIARQRSSWNSSRPNMLVVEVTEAQHSIFPSLEQILLMSRYSQDRYCGNDYGCNFQSDSRSSSKLVTLAYQWLNMAASRK